MKLSFFFVMTLFALVAFGFVTTARVFAGDVTTSTAGHRWNQSDLGPGQSSPESTVKNTGTSGNIFYRYCAGNVIPPHDPHYEATFRGGASGTATAGSNDTVTCEGNGTVTVTSENASININGNNGTQSVTGDRNNINFGRQTTGNNMTVTGNNNVIDLNGSRNNNVTTNGQGNVTHN